MIITFCGNSNFHASVEAEQLLADIIMQYAAQNTVVYCYCGGYEDFDNFAANCVNKAKKHFNNIINYLVTAYMPTERHNLDYLKFRYNEIIYPPLENVPYRYAILRRNEWLADNADIIISHVIHTMGGAEKMLKYAERKNKKIIYLNKLINK